MKRKTQTLLLVFLGLAFFSSNCFVGINLNSSFKSIGRLVTVSTNKVYYEIGEPILIYLTITNPTIVQIHLSFSSTNRVDYDIIQNNQTLYQDSRFGFMFDSGLNVMPLMTGTQVIRHTSTQYFLKGGMYQITVTLVGYCSRTTHIYVGLENPEVGQEFLGVFGWFFVIGVASILIPIIMGLSRLRD